MSDNSYQELGASANKSGIHGALSAAGISDHSGLFAGVNSDLSADENYHSILHADGAGTKSIVSYINYRESGDASCFAGLAQDALVMNLDDIYCIGAPQALLLCNTLGRNARLIPNEAVEAIVSSYKSLIAQFASLGVPVQMSGGETADCGDVVRTLMVDAVVAGRIAKSSIINAANIIPGDVIIGFSNTGQSSYDSKANSSIGSNGLTLARHALLNKEYATKYPEVVDPGLNPAAIYRGPFKVEDTPDGLGMSVGEALSSPTRSYAPVLAKLYAECNEDIHGAIHVTGGALAKVLRFGKGNKYVKNNLFPTPEVFNLIQKHGGVDWKEMYNVFNMGHRMEIYCPKESAEKIIATAASFNIDAKQIGQVEANDDSSANSVEVSSEHGTFNYSL